MTRNPTSLSVLQLEENPMSTDFLVDKFQAVWSRTKNEIVRNRVRNDKPDN